MIMQKTNQITELQTYEDPELIYSDGCDGVIYKISDGHVAKVPKRDFSLLHEYGIANGLYNAGISVPRPDGILPVKIRDYETQKFRIVSGEVMQFIPGEYLDDIFTRDGLGNVFELFDQEIEKAESLGFIPGDHIARDNSLWYNGKIWLLDFVDWVRTNREAGK